MPAVPPFTVSGEVTSLSGTLKGRPVLQLRCRESAGGLSLLGMSGSAILSGQPQRAVGILCWNQPRDDHEELAAGETAFATPSAEVLGLWPTLRGAMLETCGWLGSGCTFPVTELSLKQ